MKTNLDNTIILLMGFAGTGKYTIGRTLSDHTGAKLIDNHLINNSIFTAVNADGVTPLRAEVWDKVKQIRRIVYDTIRELSPAGTSFIFTSELRQSNPADHVAFAELKKLANARGSLFVPIRLVCDVDELCRRIVSPERRERLKSIDQEQVRKRATEDMVFAPRHSNLRTIDVTARSPQSTVAAILKEISFIRSEETKSNRARSVKQR
ncbi:MAG: hypothetical protein DMF68_19125 [Acidobacteria bacterium]|nr:MAG: hypothetical protein DMF68_19125 [Acidobacteriota bacterium]